MELKATQLIMLLIIALALIGAASADQALPVVAAEPNQTLPGCNYTCGNVSIPYPFGTGKSPITGKNCFLSEKFSVTCQNNSKLYRNNIEVLNIDVVKDQMDMNISVANYCNASDVEATEISLIIPSYNISSTKNKFISVGCNTYGYLNSFYEGQNYSTGCITRCYSNTPRMQMIDGKCSGIGCCEVDIPPGMTNITIQAFNFFDDNDTPGQCSYSFVAKQGFYKFNLSHLKHLPYEKIPMVVDWAVGNKTCEVSESEKNYACRNNSYCEDTRTRHGYRCRCNPGYYGNPYHPDGCIDIDECSTSNHTCTSDHNCRNKDGNYECFCPHGQSGNGTKEGGCHRKNLLTKVVIGVVVGFMALIMGASWVYLIYHKRKLIKLKEKFFQQNGGVILKQQLSEREESSQTVQIFTEEQLKKATNNYDESLIIGRGGFGTVFKGFLANKRVVAVKKSKVVDRSQVEQFINEVIVLSQINHRSVVKLLGCCLETQVPLLVYEYVNNGTLFDYLHNKSKTINVSWKTRLRIAAEAAGALSYLHSAASIPIIHRDVKSANILLDDTHTAKVSDFGASRLVPADQTEIATMVQGTIGYLDPEYMQTSQLTEKSDVYSFGVVLVELLTGEKALSFERPEEKRSLAMHFLDCLKENRLFEVLEIGLLNEENKEEVKEVAVLAAKCLRLKGDERPSMKEVAMELEGIRLMDKHSWTNTNINLEETQYLLHQVSSINEHGDSSSHENNGYDSVRGHVSIAFDNGR